MFQVQLVERGRCENISTLHLSPPALASASLTENTELSVVRLALDSRKRIQSAKGGSAVTFLVGFGICNLMFSTK
jgi:hypothetical protein